MNITFHASLSRKDRQKEPNSAFLFELFSCLKLQSKQWRESQTVRGKTQKNDNQNRQLEQQCLKNASMSKIVFCLLKVLLSLTVLSTFQNIQDTFSNDFGDFYVSFSYQLHGKIQIPVIEQF